MIPILYGENETEFKSNGLGLLKDTASCNVTQERNSTYELELTYKVGSFLFDEIKCNRYIKAKANNRYEPQVFRIYYISKPINGKITVKGEHYSYELKDNFVELAECNGDCQTALNCINSNAAYPTNFIFYSDIKSTANFKAEIKSVSECIVGSDGSIVDTYGNGADIVIDNNKLSVLSEGGQDNNILISYRKNMTGFKCEENWTGCITRIYPYATKEDTRITIPEKFVDSDYITRDKHPRIKSIDFSDKFQDEEITEDKLRNYAKKYFKETKCDVPSLSYSVEAVALSKTEEYKNKHIDDNLELYDYTIIRHDLYGIDTKIKVLKVNYNSLLEKYEKIELNFTRSTITGVINNTNKKIEATKEELKNEDQKIKVEFRAGDEEIKGTVENLEEETKATFQITYDNIKAIIEGAGGDITGINIFEHAIEASIMENGLQNTIKASADAIRIAWNKISNYSEINSSDGLILGNKDDGTYSKVGYDGRLALKMNGATHPYHSLIWGGSKTIYCDEDEDYTDAYESLPSMFDGIDDDYIKVIVSPKKMYDSNHSSGLYLPHWHGVYASIEDGEIHFKAMSAWRKVIYGSERIVTGIDVDFSNEDYDTDKDTIEYVETFGEATSGYLDVSFIVIA